MKEKTGQKRKLPGNQQQGKNEDETMFDYLQFKHRIRTGDPFLALEKFLEQSQLDPDDCEKDLVKDYVRSSPECVEIYSLLENKEKKLTDSELKLVFQVLRAILVRLADDLKHMRSAGVVIAQRFLNSHLYKWYRGLGRNFGLIRASLELMLAINLQSTAMLHEVFTQISFAPCFGIGHGRAPGFEGLLLKRNVKNPDEDTRHITVQFLLSFLVVEDAASVYRLMHSDDYLHQLRNIFSGLIADSVSTIRAVLTTVSEKICKNPAVTKTMKLKLFTESALVQMYRLYYWNGFVGRNEKISMSALEDEIPTEDPTADMLEVQDMTHTFLVELCCHHRLGIGFFDKMFATAKNANIRLSKFLDHVHSPHKLTHTVRFFTELFKSCPDLLVWYLPNIKHLFAPRATAAWQRSVAFLIEIYSHQEEVAPTLRVNEKQTIEQLVSATRNALLPPIGVLSCMIQAIISKEPVQMFEGLSFLRVIMTRCHHTLDAVALPHDVYASGEMTELSTRLQEELKKVLPAFTDILACWKVVSGEQKSTAECKVPTPHKTLQLEKLLQVMCLYQRVFPVVFVAHSKAVSYATYLDTIESLSDVSDMDTDCSDQQCSSTQLQLCVLELISGSSVRKVGLQRTSGKGKTLLYLLISLLASKMDNLTRNKVTVLLHKLLMSSGHFDGHSHALHCWLRHICNHYSYNTTSVDKGDIVDDGDDDNSSARNDTTISNKHDDDVVSYFSDIVSSVLQYSPRLHTEVSELMMGARKHTDTHEDMDTSEDTHTRGDVWSKILASDPIALNACAADDNAELQNTTENTEEQTTHEERLDLLFMASKNTLVFNEQTSVQLRFIRKVYKDLIGLQKSPEVMLYALVPVMYKIGAAYVVNLTKYFLGDSISSSLPSIQADASVAPSAPASLLAHLRHYVATAKLKPLAEERVQQKLLAMVDELAGKYDTSCTVVRELLMLLTVTSKPSVALGKRSLAISEFCVDLLDRITDYATGNDVNKNVIHDAKGHITANTNIDSRSSLVEIVLSHPVVLDLFLCSTSDDTHEARMVKVTEYVLKRWTARNVDDSEDKRLLNCYKRYSKKAFDAVMSFKKGFLPKVDDESGSTFHMTFKALTGFFKLFDASHVESLLRHVLALPISCFTSSKKKRKECTVYASLLPLAAQHSSHLDSALITQAANVYYELVPLVKETELDNIFDVLHQLIDAHMGAISGLTDDVFCCAMDTLLQYEDSSKRKRTLAFVEAALSCYPACCRWFKRWLRERGLDKAESSGSRARLSTLITHYFVCVSKTRTGKMFVLHWQDLIEALNGQSKDASDLQSAIAQIDTLLHLQTDPDATIDLWSKTAEHIRSTPDISINVVDLYIKVTNKLADDTRPEHCLVTLLQTLVSCIKRHDSECSDDVITHAMTACTQIAQKMNDEAASCTKIYAIWQDVYKTCLKTHYTLPAALRLVSTLAHMIYSKPNSKLVDKHKIYPVTTIYVMILSHSQFLATLLNAEGTMSQDSKYELVRLLLTLVKLDPACCTSKHIPVLLGAYTATMSNCDQALYELMYVYEKNKADIVQFKPYLWGPAAVEHHSIKKDLSGTLYKEASIEQVLALIDRDKMLHTALNFPERMEFTQVDVGETVSSDVCNEDIYDPRFMLCLLDRILWPGNYVPCDQFLDRNCLGLTLAALSSHDIEMRKAGLVVFSLFYKQLQGARFNGQQQLVVFMDVFRNSFTKPTVKVPTFVTTFCVKAVRIIVNPEHALYLEMNGFITHKPYIDFQQVPNFYRMFGSSLPEHKTHRTWMVQLLASGLRDTSDYHLLQKHHLLKHLLCHHDAPTCDQYTQRLILQVVHKAAHNPSIAVDLIRKHHILLWLHTAVKNCTDNIDDKKCGLLVDIVITLWNTTPIHVEQCGNIAIRMKLLIVVDTMLCLCHDVIGKCCSHISAEKYSELLRCLLAMVKKLHNTRHNNDAAAPTGIVDFGPVITDCHMRAMLDAWATLNKDKLLREVLNGNRHAINTAAYDNIAVTCSKNAVVKPGLDILLELHAYCTPAAVHVSEQRTCNVVDITLWMMTQLYEHRHTLQHQAQLSGLAAVMQQASRFKDTTDVSSDSMRGLRKMLLRLQGHYSMTRCVNLLQRCNRICSVLLKSSEEEAVNGDVASVCKQLEDESCADDIDTQQNVALLSQQLLG